MMKTRLSSTYRTPFVRTVACALVTLTLALGAGKAQAEKLPEHIELISYSFGVVGISSSQSLRISVADLGDVGGDGDLRVRVGAVVELFDEQGQLIFASDEIPVVPNQSHTFEFRTAGLGLIGEQANGRVQFRAELTLVAVVPAKLSVDVEMQKLQRMITRRTTIDGDIVDDLTGSTTSSRKPKEIVVVGSKVR
jgi:hypothetical protein